MKRIYSLLIVVLLLFFVTFILQNAETVDLTFLTWGIEMPKALLMVLCAVVGFLIGLLVFSFRRASPKDAKLKDHPKPAEDADPSERKPSSY